MSLAIERTETVPLTVGEDQIIHVEGTRVTLDTVVEAFQQGATAEEIVQQYPTLTLAGVYSVIGYLLRHQAEVAAYLQQRAQRRDDIRTENERRSSSVGLRARLVARRG